MSIVGRLATDLTDDQLRAVAAHIAKLCLEIERGLRPPDHLRAFLDPRAAEHRGRTLKVGRYRGGPAVRQDIGPAHLSRISTDHAVVTVVTRTEGLRWGALTFHLRALGNKWYVTHLQRLLAAAHYRTGPDRPEPPAVSFDAKIRRAAEEHRLVGAALTATEQRLAELPRNDPGRPAIQRQAQSLRCLVADLDREVRELRSRQSANRSLEQRALSR